MIRVMLHRSVREDAANHPENLISRFDLAEVVFTFVERSILRGLLVKVVKCCVWDSIGRSFVWLYDLVYTAFM